MLPTLPKDWQEVLADELKKPYFHSLLSAVEKAYADHRCYPPIEDVFSAFEACPFEDVKIVIIGQDPYHGSGQAHGLAFSVMEGCIHPPSLVNIFKEVNDDVGVGERSGNLGNWASQGVLLLNATLTVEESKAGSHQKFGWEVFTDAVIRAISDRKEHVVFMLWGNFAKAKGRRIDREKHLVLETGHPSPLSANRKLWFGNKHFSKANDYLASHGLQPIVW